MPARQSPAPQTLPPVHRQIIAGLGAPFQGVVVLTKNRNLWALSLVSLTLGLVWSGLALLELAVPVSEVWWKQGLSALANGLLGAGIIFLQILIAACAPLLDLLGERTEAHLKIGLAGAPLTEILTLRFVKNGIRAIVEALKLLTFKVVLYAVSALIHLIPLVGPPLAYLLSGIATGADFLDYPLARRGLPLKAKLARLRTVWPASISFGLSVFLILSIPGAGGIMLAPAVIGGTWLISYLGLVETP